jgi:hypothetical protein
MREFALAAILLLTSCAARCEQTWSGMTDEGVASVVSMDLALPSSLDPPSTSKAEAFALVERSATAEEAIQHLEVRRFAFKIDRATMDAFAERGADQEVLDYLLRRSHVEWSERQLERESRDPVLRALAQPDRGDAPDDYG